MSPTEIEDRLTAVEREVAHLKAGATPSRPKEAAHMPGDNPPNSRCSFCGRPRKQVGPMVEGPNEVYICDECVHLASQIVETKINHTPITEATDPSVRQAGHMHIRCYFHIKQESDGQWAAIGENPSWAIGKGATAKDAMRNLQLDLLKRTSELLAVGKPPGRYFTNHADPRLL